MKMPASAAEAKGEASPRGAHRGRRCGRMDWELAVWPLLRSSPAVEQVSGSLCALNRRCPHISLYCHFASRSWSSRDVLSPASMEALGR